MLRHEVSLSRECLISLESFCSSVTSGTVIANNKNGLTGIMFLSTVFTLFCLMASVPSSCDAGLSAHIEGGHSRAVYYPANIAISAWDRHHANSHRSGISFSRSEFTVPSSGRYYVYTQLYFSSRSTFTKNRVGVFADHRQLLMIHKPLQPNTEETASAGGIFRLTRGDRVFVKPFWGYGSVRLWVGPWHSHFGMVKID